MKRRLCLIIFTALTFSKLIGETYNREEDLRAILDQTVLKEDHFQNMAHVIAAKKLETGDAADYESMITKMHRAMKDPETMHDLMDTYHSFNDREIHELRQIFENETFQKYNEESFAILKNDMQIMEKTLEQPIDLHVQSPIVKAPLNRQIVKLTKDNYQEEVEESEVPVVIDVYTDWCHYCKLYSETFKKMHEQFKDKCLFARINADEEKILTTFLKVKAYPTTVFLYKGQVISKDTGNMSQEKLEGKIKEFLSKIE